MIPQLQLGQYPVIFSIKIFGGLILFSTRGDDGGAVFYLNIPDITLHPGYKIPHITGGLKNDGIRMYMYGRMLINLVHQIS